MAEKHPEHGATPLLSAERISRGVESRLTRSMAGDGKAPRAGGHIELSRIRLDLPRDVGEQEVSAAVVRAVRRALKDRR